MPPFSAPKPNTYVETRVALLASKETAPREILAAVGDLARRRARHPVARETIEAALGALRSEDVIAAVAELDPSTCEECIGRAAAEAFEAAFADSQEERELFAEAAIASLLVRDRVESVLAAAALFGATCGAEQVTQATTQACDRFAAVDQTLLRRHDRALTGINPERRSCLEDLDAEAKGRAVWFSSRADMDGLLEALAANPAPTRGTSDALRAELAASALPRFVTKSAGLARDFDEVESSALMHLAIGRAAPGERELLAARAEKDELLSQALRDVLESDDVPE